jgi:hypothetical protein
MYDLNSEGGDFHVGVLCCVRICGYVNLVHISDMAPLFPLMTNELRYIKSEYVITRTFFHPLCQVACR